MRTLDRIRNIAVLASVLIVVMLATGCGGADLNTKNKCLVLAPDGSSIEVLGPSAGSSFPPGTSVNFTAVAKYSDGTPIPHACVNITGTFAYPNPVWTYQFYLRPNGTQDASNVAMNNGFAYGTDNYGQYTFSAVISGATATFKDFITVQSGSIVGTAPFENI